MRGDKHNCTTFARTLNLPPECGPCRRIKASKGLVEQDDFRGTDGVFLGDDTQGSPNHPTAGENDWVVILGQSAVLTAGGAIGDTATTGSADGVPWTGLWTGQLYGAGDTAEDATSPTGIAGQFQSDNANTSVVGAFGAQRD